MVDGTTTYVEMECVIAEVGKPFVGDPSMIVAVEALAGLVESAAQQRFCTKAWTDGERVYVRMRIPVGPEPVTTALPVMRFSNTGADSLSSGAPAYSALSLEEAVEQSKKAELIGIGMSNCDLTIDDGFEEAIKAKPGLVKGYHSAWNFCGDVWWKDGAFYELVFRFHVPVAVYSAPTLRELMVIVNEAHGSE